MSVQEKKDEVKELKELIEALRESIIELRSTLSEINNPFNIMKEPGSNNEEEEEKHQESPLPLSASPVVAPYPIHFESYTGSSQEQDSGKSKKPGSNEEGDKVGKPNSINKELMEEHNSMNERVHETEYESEAGITHDQEELLKNLKRKYVNSIDTSRLTRLLRTLYIVRSKLPREAIEDIIDVLLALKLIRPQERELVAKLVDLVDKTRGQGLTPEDAVVIMYVISKSLGITDAHLEDEAFKSILKEIAGG